MVPQDSCAFRSGVKRVSRPAALARRVPLLVLALAAISSLAVAQTPPAQAASTQAASTQAASTQGTAKPNFVVFIADDMGYEECGANGHPTIRTPNLDQLAREGMRFEQAFLTCSSCSPSRSSILTGRYPHATGAEQLHWPVPADQVLVSSLLRNAGYFTAAVGKWHLGDNVQTQFDRVLEGPNPFVQAVRERPRDRPFFFWMAFHDPHRPYQKNAIPMPHRPEDVRVPPFLPDVPETRQDLALYYDEISRLDSVLGEVLAELKTQGVLNNTVVVFLSDNGRPFPRCKTTLYDSGIRTPFLVQWPGQVVPGSVCRQLVSSVDLAPTVLELAGVAQSDRHQGQSFRPLLKNPTQPIREHVFAEHNWHDFDDHGRAVRTTRWLYLRNSYPELPLTPPADAVRSPTYVVMRKLRDEHKLSDPQKICFAKPRPAEELYDVQADPHSLHNLAEVPEHRETLHALRARLERWEAETGDRVPAVRTADEFDRETGEPLPGRKGRRQPQAGQASQAAP